MLRWPAFGEDVVFSHGILEMPLTMLEFGALLECMFSQGFVFFSFWNLYCLFHYHFNGWVSGGFNYAFYDMSAQHTVTWNQTLCFCISLFSFCWMILLNLHCKCSACNDMFQKRWVLVHIFFIVTARTSTRATLPQVDIEQLIGTKVWQVQFWRMWM